MGVNTVKVIYKDLKGVEMSKEGGLVICADGSSSLIRQLFLPNSERGYAVYVARRGTVKGSVLSHATLASLGENCSFFHRKGNQVDL